MIGVPPIPLGVNEFDLILPLVRPRMGTSVIKMPAEEEIKRLMQKDGKHAGRGS